MQLCASCCLVKGPFCNRIWSYNSGFILVKDTVHSCVVDLVVYRLTLAFVVIAGGRVITALLVLLFLLTPKQQKSAMKSLVLLIDVSKKRVISTCMHSQQNSAFYGCESPTQVAQGNSQI